MLEKKVKFNNQYWLVRQGECEVSYDIFRYKEDNTLDEDFKYHCLSSNYCKNTIEKFKDVVLKANNYYENIHDIEMLASWDGDMDKSINGVLI